MAITLVGFPLPKDSSLLEQEVGAEGTCSWYPPQRLPVACGGQDVLARERFGRVHAQAGQVVGMVERWRWGRWWAWRRDGGGAGGGRGGEMAL